MADLGSHRVQELLDSILVIGSGLELEDMLLRIAEAAAGLAGARYAAVGVLDPTRTVLEQFITVGIDDAEAAQIGELPKGQGILGVLILDATPLRLADLGAHPDSFGFPPGHPPMTSFLGVPIFVRGEAFGNLYLSEKLDADEFSADDQELVVALATAAGVAIENARLHARVGELLLVEDRERIARDLHDTVIQRLFATGMSLQGTASLVERDPATASGRITQAIDDLDQTVKQIRTAIFALGAPPSTAHGVHDEVLSICREAAGALGFDPGVIFEGPVEANLSREARPDFMASLRETLSNVARHAAATRVDVAVASVGGSVRFEVVDDGVGFDDTRVALGNGLANMAARAEIHGGSIDVASGPPIGTTVTWTVPNATG